MKDSTERVPLATERPRERFVHLTETQDEATALVREFWDAMPHGSELTRPNNEEGCMQELTAGDRTRIQEGKLPAHRGKWVVTFQGNNQPLTNEAIRWLKQRGLI